MVASCNLVFDFPTGLSVTNDGLEGVFVYGGRPTYDQEQFKGKNVFVTGGSSGIGFGTSLLFARFGAKVIFVSRDSNPKWFTGKQAEEKINADDTVKANGGSATWMKADVSDKASLKAIFDTFEKNGFIIDCAVNNAGIVGAVGILKNIAQYFGGEHDAVHNNLIGTVNSLELELAMFEKHKKNATIVNLASVNGYRASALGAMYASSKFGILGLTRSLGTQYAKGDFVVRINAIAPGFTNTSLVWQQVKLFSDPPAANQTWEGDYITPSHPLWKEYGHLIIDRCPTGHIGEPLDQANMIAFLSAKESELIQGGIFTVDGLIGD